MSYIDVLLLFSSPLTSSAVTSAASFSTPFFVILELQYLPEHLIFFGVRDTEKPEDLVMELNGIKNYMVHEVRHRGLKVCVNEALEKLKAVDEIYISFDVDSLDCDLISKGTGTPVSKGFDVDEVVAIIEHLITSNKVTGLEVTEVNPLLDNKGNRMAEAAFEVIQRLFQKK